MPLPAPPLDTRTWAELTAEAQSLLPQLAPDWTDYNLHDPGITLIDLLAWLTELELFRVDRVTPSLRRSYLRLLGSIPQPPRVARTAIAVKPAGNPPGLRLSAGTQVTDPVERVVFETTADLTIGEAWLEVGGDTPGSGRLVCEAGTNRTDVTALNGGDRAFEPLGPSPQIDDALLLGFDQPPLPPAGELSLYVWTESWETDGETARRLAAEWWALVEQCSAAPTISWATRCACEHKRPSVSPPPPAVVDVTCDAAELARALRALTSRTGLPKSAGLLLQAAGAGLDISAAEADLSGSVRVPASVAREGAVIVPTRPLVDTVRRVRVGVLTLTYDGQSVVTIASGSTARDLPAYRSDARPWLSHYSARTVWEAWNGTAWVILGSITDETRSLTLSGCVRLAGAPGHARGPGDARYWLRCRLAEGGYDCPPRIMAVAVNAVPVRHAVTRRTMEELGRSTGAPCEDYALDAAPIVPGSTQIQVVKANNISPDGTWYEVAQWDESGPDDRHYRLDPATGAIAFGDGRVGRVPYRGSAVRAAAYQIGGGEVGNVRRGTLVRTKAPAAVVETLQPYAAAGGSDAESVDGAHGRALARLASTTRGVTLDDLRQLALETPGVPVARAQALPSRHPAFPCFAAPGVVTIVVLPPCGDRPMPSAAMLREIARYLERRRPVTTELHVVGPEYVGVEISATLHVSHTAADVRADAQAALDSFFHPLSGGQDGGGWPLGRDVFESEVLAVLADVPGVAFADELLIRVGSGTQTGSCGCRGGSGPADVGPGSLCGNLTLCGIQLVDSRAHQLKVVKE